MGAMSLRSLAVFCGSLPGDSPAFRESATAFGAALARERITLVYGGGSVGMMGALADAALAGGGEVVGVIPRFLLDREVGHRGVSRLDVVESMHERKARMAELADGFAALPGGLGTLEELFEVWTWILLGLHARPCGLLNVDGYFDPLVSFLDGAVRRRFLAPAHRALLRVDESAEGLIERLRAPLDVPPAKWLAHDVRERG